MTPENFCYWLQGVMEVVDPQELNREQVEIIKEHLQLVFKKETKLKLTEGKIDFNDYTGFSPDLLYGDALGFPVKLNETPKPNDEYGMNLDNIPICSHNDGMRLPPADSYLNPFIGNIPPNASC